VSGFISTLCESGVMMKTFLLAAVAMLVSVPALAQDQAACKAYFQVLRADAGSPGLRPALDSAQKNWWDNKGQKKYPGLCLSGSVQSSDKPRYIVIWSKSKTIGQGPVPLNDAFGQPASALQATAPAAPIYQTRWDQAQVTIVNVIDNGSLMLPPVYYETDQHVWIFFPNSRKVLEAAVKYLSQEPAFWSKPYISE
jgi:hypothetical protein